MDLCGQYLGPAQPLESINSAETPHNGMISRSTAPSHDMSLNQGGFNNTLPNQLEPIDESPQTQLGNVFPMMWPNVNAFEMADGAIDDDAWLGFLRSGLGENQAPQQDESTHNT